MNSTLGEIDFEEPPVRMTDPERTEGDRSGQGRRSRGTIGVVIWSSLILLLGLGLFYGWRTISNRERLTDRNLRELDRMGRTVEARLVSFMEILDRLGETRDTTGWSEQAALIPDFVRGSLRHCAQPRIAIDRAIDLCIAGQEAAVGGTWSAEPIRRALDTDLFDGVFVADSGRVAVMVAAAGGIRMRRIPAGAEQAGEPEGSTVRSASIGGRDYMIFLQPLRVPSPDYADGTGSATPPPRLTVGGLVSRPAFRAESLALGTGHLVFLGLVLILTILALPFLRVSLMGPWERVRVRDVYLLGFSLVVISGLLGLVLGDLTYYQRLAQRVDGQMESLAAEMAAGFRSEVRWALNELRRRNDEFQERGRRALIGSSDARVSGEDGPYILPRRVEALETLNDRDEIFPAVPPGLHGEKATTFLRDALHQDGPGRRYLSFQMVFWTDTAGMQVAKWTPRESNTTRVPVADRPYFSRIRERTAWPLDGEDIGLDGSPRIQHYVQSLRSKTTGENVTALSLPFCWGRDWSTRPCPREARGVSVILAPLASVHRPVLPPGVEFAVIESDGRTLFHSRPERNLDENFFEETGDDPTLRSLIAARTSDHLNAAYMGRPSRLHVQPITDTPLSLILVEDQQYLGSVHFQTFFVALAMFGTWVILLWGLILLLERVTPGRIVWVWPEARHPEKYTVLVRVLAGFAVLLVLQALLAVRFPVHPSTLLVPVQAMALGLIVLSQGMERRPHLPVPGWRHPSALGWGLLVLATALQLALHLPPGWSLLLWLLQLAVVCWGGVQVASLELSDELEASSRDPVRRSYVGSAALIIAVVGLFPGFLFYQEAFTGYLERFVRYEQVEIVEGLADRAERLRSVHRASGLPEAFDPLVVEDETGLAFQSLFASKRVPGEESAGPANPAECRWKRMASPLRTLERAVEIPVWYATGVAAEMGSLTRSETDGFDWTCVGDTLRLEAGERVLESTLPSGLWLPTSWWVLGLLLGGGVLLWVPAWVGRRVFLLDLDYTLPTALADHLSRADADESMIVVCTRSMSRIRLRSLLDDRGIEYVDLLEIMGGDETSIPGALRSATTGDGAICLDHFDQRLREPSWAHPLLVWLEELVLVRGRPVLLLTSREPSALFPRSAEIQDEDGGNEETRRWVRLLGQFVKVRVTSFQAGPTDRDGGSDREAGSPELDENLRAVLDYEGRTHPVLRRIVVRIRARLGREGGSEHLTSDALVDQIREMADSYYHALWTILEREEKLVVGQLAAGAVVNPKCERTVRRLLERRILVLEPELKLMNESFARFVREEIPPETVAEWERDEEASAWQRLRVPILLAIGAIVVFLFITQRTTFDTLIAILSTAAVGATAAVRLVTVARSSNGIRSGS